MFLSDGGRPKKGKWTRAWLVVIAWETSRCHPRSLLCRRIHYHLLATASRWLRAPPSSQPGLPNWWSRAEAPPRWSGRPESVRSSSAPDYAWPGSAPACAHSGGLPAPASWRTSCDNRCKWRLALAPVASAARAPVPASHRHPPPCGQIPWQTTEEAENEGYVGRAGDIR